ncbi:MAG: polysaccharide biosynthesis C-terminal domain-containing protein [Bacteroidales bacterium]|nr:polysaccharide biosynthesis C-terminal domain-containing protein [Bacteroidales bacterium]
MLKKIINTFSTNVLIAILNLVIAVIVSRYLGAAGKGQQSILITTIAFILLVCNIAGGASLVYLVPRYNNLKILLPAYTWTIVVCFVVYFLLYKLPDIPQQYVIHICLLTLINSFMAINSMILLGHEKIKEKNLVGLIQIVAIVLTLIFFYSLLNKHSINHYITALYVGYGLSFLLSCYFVFGSVFEKSDFDGNMKALLKDMFRYGFLNQLSHITQLLSIRLSYYFLLYYLGEDKVGIYSNAVSLAEAVWLVSKSIATVQYARIANSSDKEYSQLLSIRLSKASLIIAFLLILPIMLLPSQFYTFLFGTEFGDVNTIIRILAPGILIYNTCIIIGHYFSGLGKYHINTLTSIIGLILTVGLCLWFIPLWGIYGAALATQISFIGMSIFAFYTFLRTTRLSFGVLLVTKNDFKEIRNIIHTYKNEQNK